MALKSLPIICFVLLLIIDISNGESCDVTCDSTTSSTTTFRRRLEKCHIDCSEYVYEACTVFLNMEHDIMALAYYAYNQSNNEAEFTQMFNYSIYLFYDAAYAACTNKGYSIGGKYNIFAVAVINILMVLLVNHVQ